MSRDEFIETARTLYANARQDFLERAHPYLLDEKLREFADALVKAIGEISADEAIEALRKMAIERGHTVPGLRG